MSNYTEGKGRADHVDHLVSKRLKTRRIVLGLSQQELSEAIDVSVQQVQKYEKAINRVSSGKLYSFSKILKVPINYFFDKIDEDNNVISLNNVAEENEKYHSKTDDKTHVTEREVVTLVRAFSEVQSPKVRKQLLELIKIMSLIPKAW